MRVWQGVIGRFGARRYPIWQSFTIMADVRHGDRRESEGNMPKLRFCLLALALVFTGVILALLRPGRVRGVGR